MSNNRFRELRMPRCAHSFFYLFFVGLCIGPVFHVRGYEYELLKPSTDRILLKPKVMAVGTGDLAFVGFNSDGNDGFALVVLAELDGTSSSIEIRFTDNAWNGTSFATNEGELTWTINSRIVAGTIVQFSDVGGSESVTVGSVVVSGSMNFSSSNENLFAFTGTLASPTRFITALSTDGDASTTILSNTGLTLGTNAIDFDGGIGLDNQTTTDDDILEYFGERNNQTSFASYLSEIYKVNKWKSQDASGDQSGDSVEPDVPFNNTAFTLAVSMEVKVFLEGGYNGSDLSTFINSTIPLNQPYNNNGHSGGAAGSIPNNAVDWVLVELREAATPALALNATKVGSTAGFLLKDGSIKGTDGTSDLAIALSGNTGSTFFVVIYHRNHLSIMSANAISLSEGKYTIDFTSSSAIAYQNITALASLSGNKFGMPAGDADGDGDVDNADLSVWRSKNGTQFSYSAAGADFNLDGVVNAVDRNIYWKLNNGVSKVSQVPTN